MGNPRSPRLGLLVLAALSLLLAAFVAPTHAQTEQKKPPYWLKLDLGWLHNDDLSEHSAALDFDIGYLHQEDLLPAYRYGFEIQASGTLAEDPDLNTAPLIAEFDAFLERLLGSSDQSYAGQTNSPDPLGNYAVIPFSPFYLQSGLTARYETDQTLDHRNGVAAAYVELSNNNIENWWALLPDFRVALDGVFEDQNLTAATMGIAPEDHLRLRAVAHWSVGLGMFGDHYLLNRSYVSATLEYSQSYGLDDRLEAAGLDDAFGSAIEYNWLIRGGAIEGTATNKSPMSVFVRLQTGRFAPETEDSSSVLAGFRIGMGDAKKLFSR